MEDNKDLFNCVNDNEEESESDTLNDSGEKIIDESVYDEPDLDELDESEKSEESEKLQEDEKSQYSEDLIETTEPTEAENPSVLNEKENNTDNRSKTKQTKNNSILICVGVVFIAVISALFGGYVYKITHPAIGTTVTQENSKVENDKSVVEVSNTEIITVNNDVTKIVEENMPAMVSINTTYTITQDYGFFGTQTYETTGAGSGIIIKDSGNEIVVLTNAHVTSGAKTIEIVFCDDEVVEGVLKSYSEEDDIALVAIGKSKIKVETLNGIKCASLGDSTVLKLGEPVIAIGNSLGYGQTVTVGVISGLNRSIEDSEGYTRTLIQTDAAINPGNSGGALLNMAGQVIGINESKIVDETVDGVGFAIPISLAIDKINELGQVETREKVAENERGYLGITCVDVGADAAKYYHLPTGAYIDSVEENSAAKKAGLQEGDIIVKAGNQTVTGTESLVGELSYHKYGENISITYKRSNNGTYQEYTVNVVLGQRPSAES